MVARRWQDWTNIVLASWLFVSPWVLGYAGTSAAWNARLVGTAIAVFALVAIYTPQAWEELVNTAAGVWLVVSPFVLNFTAMETVSLHTVVVGILVTAFATWALFGDKRIDKRWHSGIPHDLRGTR